MKTLIVNKLQNTEIKTKGKYTWPVYKTTGVNDFILGGVYGIRGAGKTTAVLQFLENDKDIVLTGKNKVYFISPTCDEKVQSYIEKYPDNFEYIDELTPKTIGVVLDEIKAGITVWEQDNFILSLLQRYLNKEKLDEGDMMILEESGYMEDYDIEGHNFDHPNISTIIIDDSMGSPMISSSNSKIGKDFIRFIIKHRHHPHYCNVILLSQHIKSISKPIRTNQNFIIVFPMRDQSIYKSIFDEYSGLFGNKYENFLNTMKEIEGRPHSFLFLYYDKRKFARLNWGEEIVAF